MNIAFAQVAAGTILAFTLIGLLDERRWKKLLYCILVSSCFGAVGGFVYRQALTKQADDEARKNKEDKQASDLSGVSDRLKYALKELDDQKIWRAKQEKTQQLASNPAMLIPGEDYSLKGGCGGPNAVNVFLGSDGYGSSNFPFTAIQIQGKSAITVDGGFNGYPYVTFDVEDDSGNLLARVIKNEVFVLPQYANLVPRKDLHHLEVINTKGAVVMSAYFANKHVIKFTGTFFRNGRSFSLGDTNDFGSKMMSGNTMCGMKIGVSLE